MDLTKLAIEKIKEFADGEGLPYIVRVKIVGGGCSGMTHEMEFISSFSEEDYVLSFEDVKIIIDQISMMYLENVSIDYIESNFGGGFKFNSPDIKSTCGCGKSVSY